jgi:hypothetical protein
MSSSTDIAVDAEAFAPSMALAHATAWSSAAPSIAWFIELLLACAAAARRAQQRTAGPTRIADLRLARSTAPCWPNGFPDRTVCAAVPAALGVFEANRPASEAVVRHVLTPLLWTWDSSGSG